MQLAMSSTSGSTPEIMGVDPLFMASRLFRHRRFEDCVNLCTEVLQKNPFDQVLGIKVGNQDNML